MSAFDEIVRALETVGMRTYVQSDSARAQCPVHQSRGLTLSVRRGDGRAYVNCFASCDDVDVLAAIGMTVADLFDEPRRPEYRRPGLPVMPPAPAKSPWETAMASLGIHNPPPVEHLLHRMEIEAIKEGIVCGDCLTEASPWSCSCGALKAGGRP